MTKSDSIFFTTEFFCNSKIKISQLGKNSLRMMEFDKDNFTNLNEIEESQNSGIYFLVDNFEIYVGQATNLFSRINNHIIKNKKFNKVICFFSINNELSKTYIDYLEWNYINKLKNKGIYQMVNIAERSKKPDNLTKYEKSCIEEMVKTVDMMLLFAQIDLKQNSNSEQKNLLSNKHEKINNENTTEHNIFYYKNATIKFLRKINNRGFCNLLKNSKIKKNMTTKNANFNEKIYNDRQIFLSKNRIYFKEFDNDHYVLLDDIKEISVSLAACLVDGVESMNGWTTWKNNKNQTIDMIYRK